MTENLKDFGKIKGIKFLIFGIAILLILLVAFLIYYRFVPNDKNRYSIQNKYYGFQLETPKSWIAEEKTSYSENEVGQLIVECQNNKSSESSVYEIGSFRFKDQKYPLDFGNTLPPLAGFPSGAILNISVSCMPDVIKSEIYNFGNLSVGGEKASEQFLNLSGFGKTKFISFFHKNLQYKIFEYVYISPEDKGANEGKIRESYGEKFDKIISDFKFTK